MAAPPMPLVDYSDSDSDDSGTPPPTAAPALPALPPALPPAPPSFVLPPLPSRFHDLYAVAPRLSTHDDPALHSGRKRSAPHVCGNWATHVFIEWHLSRTEFDVLACAYRTAATAATSAGIELHSHLTSDLGAELPLHLSLSRPNVLATAQREGFVELLEERVEKARITPFDVTFSGFEWVCNAEHTRWFLVLKAASPSKDLLRLLQLTNRTFEALGQPPLKTAFHVSLAWGLQKPSSATADVVLRALAAQRREIAALDMGVRALKVRVGNAVHVVELKKEEGVKRRRRE